MMSLMTVSCNSELDIEKHGNMGSMDTYYTTDDNVMTGTASLYLEVKSAYYNWFFVKNLLSDDLWCGGGQRGDNGEMEKLNEYSFDSNHGMIESLYKGFYGIIYKANLLIDKTEGESAVMKRAVNEAKVFRALGHFELVTLFGTAPVVDHLLTPDEYQQSNSTPEELWAIVEKDLTEAINSGTLPSKNDANDGETGIRATKEFAQALLGKAYLFQGKNSEAASMLDNVINSNKYALFPGEYDAMFHAAANNNCESVFELQKRNDPEQLWNTFDMVYIMQGWRTSVLNYDGEALATLALGNYGFSNPRKSLYDAFTKWEGEDGYRKNKTIWNIDQLKAYGVDKRYCCWLLRPTSRQATPLRLSTISIKFVHVPKRHLSLLYHSMTSRWKSAWSFVTRVYAIKTLYVGEMPRLLWLNKASKFLLSLAVELAEHQVWFPGS